MGILSKDDKSKHRQDLAKGRTVKWEKEDINKAHQAIDDWFDVEKTKLSAVIDAATAPFKFGNGMKRAMVGSWMQRRFKKERS